jgi:hypothetical protein
MMLRQWLEHVAAWIAQQPGGRLLDTHGSFAIITGMSSATVQCTARWHPAMCTT